MTLPSAATDLELLCVEVDEGLDPEWMAEFGDRLATSADLRDRRARLSRIREAVRLAAPQPPPDAARRICAAAALAADVRAAAPSPPFALVDRVVAGVDAREKAAVPGPAAVATSRRTVGTPLRLFASGAVAAAAAAAVILWLRPVPAPEGVPAASPDSLTTAAPPSTGWPGDTGAGFGEAPPAGLRDVVVRVDLPDASAVAVAGSFNGWDARSTPLALGPDGRWSATVRVPAGDHEYMLVVDGGRWQPDPGAARRVPDGFGGWNGVIEVR